MCLQPSTSVAGCAHALPVKRGACAQVNESHVMCSVLARVHKNKSMQRLISSLWGPGTAKFQVT